MNSESSIMPIKPPTFRPPGWRPAPNKQPEAHDRFYSTQAWKRTRAIVLKRDGYRCTAIDCSTPSRGLGGRLVVDHVIERRDGGADHVSNLRTLCPTCDNRRHGRRGRGVKSPRSLGCDRPGPARAFPQNSETFFLTGGGGVGRRGRAREEDRSNVHF
jgi:5-methylcytosine-specific restriction enzyme A